MKFLAGCKFELRQNRVYLYGCCLQLSAVNEIVKQTAKALAGN